VPPTTTTTLPPTFGCQAQATGQGNGTVTTNAVTASQGDKFVALVAANGPVNQLQSVTLSGGNLNWSKAAEANTEQGAVEILTATSGYPLSATSFTSTPAIIGYDQMVYICAFTLASGYGAENSASAFEGAPEMRQVALANGSQFLFVGIDPTSATPRVPITGQTVTEWVDTGENVTMWWQEVPSPGQDGRIVVGDISPTRDRFNIAAIEVTPQPGG
jgi:hypothetical protein